MVVDQGIMSLRRKVGAVLFGKRKFLRKIGVQLVKLEKLIPARTVNKNQYHLISGLVENFKMILLRLI